MPTIDHSAAVRRLYWEQAAGWMVAWLIGIGSLLAVAITTHSQLFRQDLDAELALVSTAVYGLTWFDDDGAFHDEILRREPDLIDGDFDIWVVGPDGTVLLAPTTPRWRIEDLPMIASKIVVLEKHDLVADRLDATGRRYRLSGSVTYDAEDRARAAILVAADPTPWTQSHRDFVRRTAAFAIALLAVGWLIGGWLSRRALRPVLASLDQQQRFLTAAAHELKTPVASLRAVLESVGSGTRPDEALDDATHLVSRTGELVDQLLLSARLDAAVELDSRQSIRLDLLVETLLPEDGSIELDAEPTVVDAEPLLVEVAVRNLIDNARRHATTDAGPPTIRVAVRDRGVTVVDDGPGFGEALLAKATEPFVSTSRSPGSGLGLAITRRIAERHGGRLHLANRRPTGARVVLRLG